MNRGKSLIGNDDLEIPKDKAALQEFNHEFADEISEKAAKDKIFNSMGSWGNGTVGGFIVKRETEMAMAKKTLWMKIFKK